MKKITSLLTILIFSTTSLLHAIDTDPNVPKEGNTTNTPPQELYEGTSPPEDTKVLTPDQTPKEVGKASEEGLSSATRDTWIKFGVAAVAVAVAVTALILVSNHKGKKS